MMKQTIEPPPEQVRDRGGGGAGWKQLVRAANDIDAHLLIGRLSEAGIETRTVKDRSGPGAWLHGGSDPWAPSTIYVRAFELEDARLVLAELAYSGPPAEEPFPRPSHGSGRAVPVVWWTAAILLGLLLTGIGLARTAGSMDRCDIPLLCAAPLSP